MSAALTVIAVPAPSRIDDVTSALRTLVESADGARRAAPDGPVGAAPQSADAVRTWAVLGELVTDDAGAVDENQRAVAHDLVGRLAVRLAVDKVLCVGSSRAVRALYQGTVMEGSWGDEVRMASSATEALEILGTDPEWMPQPGDTVLLAAPGVPVQQLADRWRQRFGHEVTLRPALPDAGTNE
ncbi:UDP-N-acetylmuramoyl-tripeptide--D-alanyl-D-alanine ligase [Gordonia sp. DT30]|uniref:UDP-N-acetylmuramoyl-tripeptide--D-alanyl-D- alanine ligase n=1 Tax=unclassified Gordonia (in: high G+C Gram-positive bacteria) TaxID=2657482 RepID=UPI003CF65BD1